MTYDRTEIVLRIAIIRDVMEYSLVLLSKRGSWLQRDILTSLSLLPVSNLLAHGDNAIKSRQAVRKMPSSRSTAPNPTNGFS